MHEAEIVSWHTGSGYQISLQDLKIELKKHISDDGELFIGCDSYLAHDKCVFAIALCAHGAKTQSGGRYYWYRRDIRAEKYKNFRRQKNGET